MDNEAGEEIFASRGKKSGEVKFTKILNLNQILGEFDITWAKQINRSDKPLSKRSDWVSQQNKLCLYPESNVMDIFSEVRGALRNFLETYLMYGAKKIYRRAVKRFSQGEKTGQKFRIIATLISSFHNALCQNMV